MLHSHYSYFNNNLLHKAENSGFKIYSNKRGCVTCGKCSTRAAVVKFVNGCVADLRSSGMLHSEDYTA
jgi:hypothetical protein